MMGDYTTMPTNATTEGNVVDCEDEPHFRNNIPAFVMLSIFSVIGIFGNSLVIYVYGVHFKNSTTRVFILSLAVFDLITCASLPYKLILLRYGYLFQNVHLARLEIMRVFFLQVSVMILPLVSIDRYRRVCVPFKKQVTPRIAKLLVFGVIFLMASICAFRMAVTKEGNSLCYRAEAFISQSYLNKDIQTTWVNRFYFVCVFLPFITPLPILIIMYSLVGSKVRNLKSSKSNETGSTGNKSDKDFPPCRTGARSCPKSYFRKKLWERFQIGDTNDSFQVCSQSRSKDLSTSEERHIGEISESSLTSGVRVSTTATPMSASSPTRHSNDSPLELSESVTAEPSSKASADVGEPVPEVPDVTILNKSRPDIMSRPQRVTLIFFLITLVYIISCIPLFAIFIIFRVNPVLGHHLLSGSFFIVLYDFVYITVVSNCFLYGFFDPRFRREVKLLQDRLKKRFIVTLRLSED